MRAGRTSATLYRPICGPGASLSCSTELNSNQSLLILIPILSHQVDEFTWMRGSLYALLFMLVRGPTDSIMQRILTEEPQMGKLIFMVYV